jgi:riboflavin kinase/FMN adenylyltransferase
VASVGRRPTVNPLAAPLLEVHLLERDEPLYGKRLQVTFLKKLRDEARFDGLAPLREAIAQDAREAREFFAKHG